MKGKKFLSLLLAVILASGFQCTTSLAALKKITAVSLSVDADILPGGSIFDQQASITVKNNRIEVVDYEFINSGFQWYDQDVPRIEVELYSEEGYYFSTSDKSFTISGGTYVKQRKENSSRSLFITIDLPKASEFTQEIESAVWSSSTVAGWSQAAGAGSYEVKLYRDGKTVGTVRKTDQTSWDFTEAMTKAGSYTFRVRPVNKVNQENTGEWVESAAKYVDNGAAELNRANGGGALKNGSASGIGADGWKRDQTGWWYVNIDGSYTVNNWQSIDGQWYFFNENGYMAAGWVDWNGKQYYCDIQSGQLLVNETTPDGHPVGADGARLP